MEAQESNQRLTRKAQYASLTYGMFVFCQAAESLIKQQLACTEGLRTDLYLQQDEKMFVKKFFKGVADAKYGVSMFNERTENMFFELEHILTTDQIRKDAAALIKHYMQIRNRRAKEEGKPQVFTPEFIESFTIK